MAKRRKVRIDRILTLLLISVSLIGVFVFGGKKIYSLLKEKMNDNEIVDPVPVATDENVKLSLQNYQIYKDDSNELGFSFIVAEFMFTGENGISYDLGNLQTSEKILLNNTAKYFHLLSES